MIKDKLQFYRVTDAYIDYLRTIDRTIQPNYPGKTKPHLGVIININNHQYFAPLSSYKTEKHDKITNNSIYKIYGNKEKTEKLSVIHLNNMFPIIETEIERIDFGKEEKHYKDLLEKEYSYIISNQEDIQKKARKLYDDVISGKPFFTKISSNFPLLESEYQNFKK